MLINNHSKLQDRGDYERIATAIGYIRQQASRQPGLDEIATASGVSPAHFHRLFSRWTGITPKRFLQTLTIKRAKELLDLPQPVLEASYSAGLSSASRLYDHFVQLEAVTPGEYKLRGKGLRIEYALQATPFGQVFIAVTQRGITQLQFVDEEKIEDCVSRLRLQWPLAEILEEGQKTTELIKLIFFQKSNLQKPLSLHVKGTNFQVNVWKALLQIPPACLVSYKQIAQAVGQPKAARAVGTAIGHNPVAFAIPCHRVIQQSGKIGGYRWGENRKHAMHAWESAIYDNHFIRHDCRKQTST